MSKKSKKDGKGKGKKSYSEEKVYHSFNTLDYKTLTAVALIDDLYIIADKVLADHNLTVNVWHTFANLENQVTNNWDADKPFIRHWLDAIVEEFGYMICNEVYRKYWNEEWYTHGILHDVPEMPKKLRANPEAVAGHFADSAATKYKEHYK